MPEAGRSSSRLNENVQVVRRGFEAMRRWDVDALMEDCDPELEFVSLVGQVEGRTYRGQEGMRMFFADLTEAWDRWDPVPEQFESAGDVVLATGTTHMRGKGSGVEIELKWGQVFRLRDRRVLWAQIYADQAEARRQFHALTG